MKNKIFLLMLSIASSLGTAWGSNIAAGTFGEDGDNLSWTLSNDSVLTISGTGNMPNYKGNSGSSDVPAPWKNYQASIAYVVIQAGVSYIGEYAFYECSKVKSAEIPNSVTFIGGHAFERCTNLVIINIPNSVTSIGSYVFRECDNLLTPQYNEKIFAYLPASYVGAYSVPDGIETIAGGAFAWCEELTSLQLPQSLIEIGGNGAISRCKKLASITIPKNVINIGKQAFNNDTQLTSITFQSHKPATIGQNAFPSCDLFVPCNTLEAYQSAWTTYASQIKYAPNQSFQLATYPINQVTSELISDDTNPCDEVTYSLFANAMDGYIFSQWSDGNTDNPRTITLTQDTLLVAEFTQNAISRYQVQFVDWDGTILLTDSVDYGASAIAPANPTREGYTFTGWDKAFDNVTEDLVVTAQYTINRYQVQFVDWDATILHTDSVDYGASATAPANPTREGYTFTGWDKAFDNVTEDMVVTALYENNICIIASGSCGDNLTWEISCDSVLTIEGTGAMTDYRNTSDIPWYNFLRNIREIIVEDGVTSIGERAFMSCWKLIKCSIGNSVTSIGVLAFYGCYNMPSVTIPNNVSTIGARAFESCYKLESVTIPQNVTSLGETAFGNCDSLTTIIWNAVNCTIQGSNHSPFYNIQEKGNNKITSFIVGDSVEHLPAHLCYNMSKLNSINIPSSIKSIKPEAFYGTKLIAVHISDIAAWCRINFMSSKTANPLYYAHHLYLNGEEITNLVIPDGVTEISNRAFVGYSTMESISIPNTVVRIGHTAFDSCTGLTSIVIPDGVTEIGNQAFMRCSNLQHVSIGDNVISIGNEVFKGCTSLITPIYNSHTFFVMPTSYSGAYIIPDGIENVIGSAFYQCNGLTSINIPNSVKLIGEGAFIECSNLAEITIGTGVSALGKNVFNKCANIKKVQWNAINYRQTKPNNDSNCFPFYASRDSINSFIFGEDVEYIPEYLLKDFSAIHSLIIPASVKEIAKYAFANDSLTEMTCLAEIPPIIDSTAIVGMNTSTCVLYVPYSSVNTYRNANVWKEFVNIQAIGAEEVEEPGDAIVVTPSSTSASLIWTLISNAATYELVIRDMNGNVICTLTFNALGQLTGIAFAPNRSREAQQTQAAGFQFTVSGLNSGTTYEYALTAFDENDNIIETLTGTFTTTNDVSTDIEQMNEDALNIPQKIMRDGNVYILRGDKVFTLHGKEVK